MTNKLFKAVMCCLITVSVLWALIYTVATCYDRCIALEKELIDADYTIREMQLDMSDLNDEVVLTQELLHMSNQTIADLKSDEYELVYLGEFKITYYCDMRYDYICSGTGITASGKPTETSWTAAADWDVLPKGSIVYINGIGFREIQDVGGSVNGKHIDVLVERHQDALDLGVKYEGVWILIRKSS